MINKEISSDGFSLSIVLFGFVTSFILLLIFFVLRSFDLKGMLLDAKWIVFASLPLLISLIIGGIISKIKFGEIEISTSIKKPIESDRRLVDFIEIIQAQRKGSRDILNRLRIVENKKVIEFEYGNQNYHESDILRYFDKLTSLEFILVTKNSEFLYLIDLGLIKDKYYKGVSLDMDLFALEFWREFANSIASKTLEEFIPDILINKYVDRNDSILHVVKKFYKSQENVFPVLDEMHRMKGIVRKSKIEQGIINELIRKYDYS